MVVKKKIVLLFTAIIAVIAISLLVRAGGSDIKLKKQLDLGQKYLSELNYEQAAACFLAAIEIDENSVDAYLGAAKAYEAIDDVRSAIDILQKGFKITGDDRLQEEINRLQSVMEAQNNTESIKEETKDTVLEDFVIQWKDPVFEGKVREALNIPTGDIMASQLEQIYALRILGNSHVDVNDDTLGPYGFCTCTDGHLDSYYDIDGISFKERGDITSLDDIVYFTNLTDLTIIANHITDASPVLQLTNLEHIILAANDITNFDIIPEVEGYDTLNYIQRVEIGDEININ